LNLFSSPSCLLFLPFTNDQVIKKNYQWKIFSYLTKSKPFCKEDLKNFLQMISNFNHSRLDLNFFFHYVPDVMREPHAAFDDAPALRPKL